MRTLNPQIPQLTPAWDTGGLFSMLSPSSVKQILVRSSLQLELLSRISHIWLPVDSKSTDLCPVPRAYPQSLRCLGTLQLVCNGSIQLTIGSNYARGSQVDVWALE